MFKPDEFRNIDEGSSAPESAPENGSGNAGEKDTNDKQPELKYSDADVDKIIKRRLAKERAKYARLIDEQGFSDELIEREKAVTEKELRLDARERMADAGIPASFAGLLNYSDRDKFEESFKTLSEAYNSTKRAYELKSISRPAPTRGAGAPGGSDESDKLRAAFGLKK